MSTTKYPIILVHGMINKDFRFWRAFRVIRDFLQQQGYAIYVSNQDGVGSIATNAQQLKEEILEILKKENCEKVNLIAHSKGGLDSRYMISRLDMGQHIASLTTLSTPHHGSRLSAWLLKMPRFLSKTIAFCYNVTFRILGDRKPDMFQLGLDMTPENMERFNQEVLNDPQVYYQSFSSTTPVKAPFLRNIPYKIARYCEQEDTDGIVSVTSSQWGNYRGSLDPSADHFDMAGIFGSKKKLKDVALFYAHIVQELQTMGF